MGCPYGELYRSRRRHLGDRRGPAPPRRLINRHDRWYEHPTGTVGIWRHSSGLTPEVVAEVEALGDGAICLGGSPDGDLGVVDELPYATARTWAPASSTCGRTTPPPWPPLPPDRRRLPGSLPARPRNRASRSHPGVPATEQARQLPGPARRPQGPGLGPGVAAQGPRVRRLSAERPPGARPTWSRRSTPGRRARSSATGRCSPRSRSSCSRPTWSGPAPSACCACRTRTSASPTTSATCASSAGRTPTWPTAAATR